MTTTETTIVNGPAPKLPPHRPKTVTVPVKPCIELAHRLGLTDVQACEAVGIGRSLWYQAKRTGQISKTVALAFEALYGVRTGRVEFSESARRAVYALAIVLTTAFVVLSVGARYILAGIHREHAMTMLRMGAGMAAVLAPLQLLIGDQHGLQVAQYQPPALAAIEGHWENDGPAPLVLFLAIAAQGNQDHAK